MADDNVMSNQEGFLKSFASSTTKMSAAIASFVVGVDAFNTGNMELASNLKKWGQTFSITNMILNLEKMTQRYNDARIELAKSFGVYGERRTGLMKVLQEERKDFLRYGITLTDSLEEAIALSNKFGSMDFVTGQKGLISTTSLIAKAFNVSAESAAEVSSKFSLFAGRDSEAIRDTMEYMATMADAAGISTSAVFENMKSAANVMYLFNLQGANADRKMADLAVFATGIGMDLGSAVKSLESMRDPMQAVQASAKLAQLGIQTSATQLMAMSFGPPETTKSGMINMLSQLQGMDPAFQAQQFKVLGDVFGMSSDQMAESFKRMNDVGFDKLVAGDKESLKALEDMAEAQMGFSARFDALVQTLFSALDPVARMIFPILDGLLKFFAENERLTQIIAIASMGIFAIQKSEKLKGAVSRGLHGMGMGGLSDKVFGAPGKAPQPRDALGRFTSKGNAGFMSKISGKGLMQGAAGLLLAAGAVFVLGKALKEFQGLDWETLKVAGASIVGLLTAVGIAGIGPISTAIAAGSLVLAAASTAFAVFGWSMGVFSKGIQPLLGHGEDIKMLGEGLTGIFSSLALMPVASIGGLVGGLFGGTSVMIRPLEELLQFAENDIQPLKELGEVLTKISNAMESISASNLSTLQAEIGAAGRGGSIPLENHIRIDLDGRKLWDGMAETKAGKR